MKKFKRMLALICAVLMMACVLTACGPAKTTDAKSEDSKPTYIIYSDNSFAPFEYLDTATNTYVGLDMDILAAIAADQGFNYEVYNEGFDAAMGAVQSGQADGMIAGMTITEKRQETFDFSDSYFEDGQIMVVAAGSTVKAPEDLKGGVVAVKTSTQGAAYAESIKDKYGFEVQYYEDSPTMYTAVTNGTNVACFEDRSVIGWAIASKGLTLKTVGDVINPGSYGFAVKKGENADLIKMFNDGLANIKANNKYNEILVKYGY